jgi:N-acetylmuramoyl-L-alanine amidase
VVDSYPPVALPPLNRPNNQPALEIAQSTKLSEIALQNFQVTRDGFFIRTSGSQPEIKVQRSEDRRTINIALDGAILSPSLSEQNLQVNRYGVSSIQFAQQSSSQTGVNIKLNVSEDSPNWQASFSRLGGGIVLLPLGESASQLDNSSRIAVRPAHPETIVRTIETPTRVNQSLFPSGGTPDRSLRASSQPNYASIPVPPPETINPPMPAPRARNGKLLVIVDPGHGGKDGGAPSVAGYDEKEVVLAIGQQVASLLEQQGIQAVMTRDSDYFVDLKPRVDMAERLGANLFVSIHANSIDGRPDVNGLETYHYGRGERLARTIHNSILRSIDIRDRGVRSARFYVIRNPSMPSVLVETGYVTSPTEAPKLANPAYQRQMAEAIVRGIMEYIQQNF